MGQTNTKHEPLTFQKKLDKFKYDMKDSLRAFQSFNDVFYTFRESGENLAPNHVCRSPYFCDYELEDQTAAKKFFKSKLKNCQELLSQREKLLKFVSSAGFTVSSFDQELRLVLCEISVSAIQMLFDYSSKRFLTNELAKYTRLIHSLNLSIKSPEQCLEIVELLKVTEDGNSVQFILHQLKPHIDPSVQFILDQINRKELLLFGVDSIKFIKEQPKLFDLAWFQKCSRSAAVANILLCGKFPKIELEKHGQGVSEMMLKTLDRIRPEILQLCRHRGSHLTPVLMVCSLS